MWRNPLENVTYEFLFASPAIPCMSCWSWMFFEMGGRWPRSHWIVECCFQNLFKWACCILMKFPSSFCVLLASLWCIHIVVLTQLQFRRNLILFYPIHQISIWSITSQWYSMPLLCIWWHRLQEIKWCRCGMRTNFRSLLLRVEMALFSLKHVNSVVFAFISKPVLPAACSRLCIKDSTWAGLFARSTGSFVQSSVVIVSVRYCLILVFFLMWNHFLLLNLLMFKVYSLSRVYTNMVLMYLLTRPHQQCWRSCCLHQMSELLLLHFYKASL